MDAPTVLCPSSERKERAQHMIVRLLSTEVRQFAVCSFQEVYS